MRRHYSRKVSRREAATNLAQRGLVEQAPVRSRPARRLEAPSPMDLVQIDVMHMLPLLTKLAC